MGEARRILAIFMTFPSGQTSTFMVLEAICHALSGGSRRRRNDEALMIFFPSPPFFFSPLIMIHVGMQKLKMSCHFIYCIKFDSRSFYCYLFYFEFFWIDFFKISSLNIWFHLIFISNLVLILLVATFFYHFLNWLFFNFIPQHLASFYFYIKFGTYFLITNCFVLDDFLIDFFSILSFSIWLIENLATWLRILIFLLWG